jgi:glutathione S-transferase
MREPSDPVTLIGFDHSVYQRTVRVMLAEKGVSFETEALDPFDPAQAARLRLLHPFGRVPVLKHGNFVIYETDAICRYLDAAFAGPILVPTDHRASARMEQILSIWDGYGYWPFVRQVFARRVFEPWEDEAANEAEIAAGLRDARSVLTVLNGIAAEGLVLRLDRITLACCKTAAMLDYFTRAPEGSALLERFPSLHAWWMAMRQRSSLVMLDGSSVG